METVYHRVAFERCVNRLDDRLGKFIGSGTPWRFLNEDIGFMVDPNFG
jgi:hypothetical protein